MIIPTQPGYVGVANETANTLNEGYIWVLEGNAIGMNCVLDLIRSIRVRWIILGWHIANSTSVISPSSLRIENSASFTKIQLRENDSKTRKIGLTKHRC